ncbi:DEAD/DEAH box helicase family protein [Streptomyces sp. NPDC094468]|uniref:DEAD/DEAH box helicase family protein n=1 Tax=Streptomyces sp. NPDC094468 TaxID=3366066 RepID=UPI00381B4482
MVGEEADQIRALTVMCTYDSLTKIKETRNTGFAVPPFDRAVMDEAHRIAGRADKRWAIVRDAKRIRADRRLYMTATPTPRILPRRSWRSRRPHPPAPLPPPG